MSVSLLSYSLASLAELKAFLGNVTGTGQDDNLTSALNRATDIVEQALGGRWLVTRGTVTEYHSIFEDTTEIRLRQWPIVSVTSVHECTDFPRVYDSTTILTVTTDYELDAEPGVVRRFDSGPTCWATGSRVAKVIYVGGYKTVAGTPTGATAIPERFKQAALEVAAALFSESDRRAWGVSSRSDALGNVTRFMGVMAPSLAARLHAEREHDWDRTWEGVTVA